MPPRLNRERSALGLALIRLRREHGNVSQAELARRTVGAVSAGHIAQIETGDRGASVETLLALGQALGATGREQLELAKVAGFRPMIDESLSDEDLDRWYESAYKAQRAHEMGQEASRLQAEHEELRRQGAPEDRLASMERTMAELVRGFRDLSRDVAKLLGKIEDAPPLDRESSPGES